MSVRALRESEREEGWQGWVLKCAAQRERRARGADFRRHASLARVTRRSLADGADHSQQGPPDKED